ncbi:hypothetical protein J8M21_03970 [Pseudoalteromonas luteoviolacea]|uniref:hypothetical protein n=1 Tax=Pseudoalteromonas luteoviolacea TaxID=43657 RepID=UPI001B39D25C|nr:hypothetical protein [Pseudoalteromonas luteoviolacea]MBQ4876362.1 hypothetical protein [Pseudoalteromonas luteoviolacea]MBQ4904992.1 hypothetical protein [Pseudoalteromonas luteoviolacea]
MARPSLEDKINANAHIIVRRAKLIFAASLFTFALFKFIFSLDSFERKSVLQQKYHSISSTVTELTCSNPKKGSSRYGSAGTINLLLQGAPRKLRISLHEVIPSNTCTKLKDYIRVGDRLNLKITQGWNQITYMENNGTVLYRFESYMHKKENQHDSAKYLWVCVMIISTFMFIGWDKKNS